MCNELRGTRAPLATQWFELITRSYARRSNCRIAKGNSGRYRRYWVRAAGRCWINDVRTGARSITGEAVPGKWSNAYTSASGKISHSASTHFSPPRIDVNHSWTIATRPICRSAELMGAQYSEITREKQRAAVCITSDLCLY